MEEKQRRFAWANRSLGLIDVAGKSKKLLSPSSAPNSPFDPTPSTPTSSTPSATPTSTVRSLPSFSEDLSLDQTKLPNPMDTANILSWLCWQWVGDLVNKGRKRQLRPTDLYGLSSQDTALFVVERLEREWEFEKQQNRNSLVLAFFRIWGIPFLLNGLYGLGEDLFLIGQAVILGYLIDALGDNDPGYWYCFGISLAGIASVLVHHQYFFGGERISNQMKAATIGLVYKKAISLSNSAFATTTVGQIINLVTSDCERFLKFGYYFFYVFAAPIELAVTLYILWGRLGASCLLGLGLVCVMVPFQMWFGKKFGELRQQTVQLTDSRVRLMNEVISGIRIMKMFGWEPPYAKKIADVRTKEMEKVRQSSFLRGLNISMFLSTGLLLALSIFFTYRFTGHDLTPSKVLVTLAIFAVVQRTISFNVPTAIEAFSEIRVTMKRIQTFLMLEDFQPNNFSEQDLKDKGAFVLYRNVCASWANDYGKDPTLTDISLDATPGRLVAVVGPVGCGKSSLLLSIVNELRCIPNPSHSEFKREVVGNIAYVSQTPWIISGTVEENITMGSPYDQEKMNHVVDACALERDLQIMPDGFTTEIGDKGTTLSGGQKARISLARAVYSNKDIYLLDDPLSAVDPAVANHLFHKCIKSALQHKVVILATHQVQFLSHCDEILILTPDGEVEARGKYFDLADRLHKYEGSSVAAEKKKLPAKPGSRRPSIIGPPAPVEEDPLIKDPPPIIEQKVRLDFSPTRGIARGQSTVKIVEEEVRKTGSVSAFVYSSFISAVGRWWFALIFLLVAVAQGLNIITYWWLARWAAQSAAEQVQVFLPTLLAALTLTTIVVLVTRSILFFHRLLGAASDVHNQMLNRIMTTPVDFFSANPIGRILNRFSRDIGIMDEIFPGVVVDCVQLAFFCLGVVVFVCVINAFVLVTLVPIFLGFIYIRNRFVKTSREVKRIEATSRSPIQAHFTTSLDGIVSIRGYQLQDDFIKQALAKQDANTRASFALAALGRWIGFELDGLSIIFLIITVFFAGFSQELLSLKPYLVGLSIVYCIQLLDVFQWCTRQSTEVENQMTSVERCLAYTTLAQEPPYALDTDKDLPLNWPSKGAITLKNVSFSYQSIVEDEIEEKFILNDINAIIESNWKVGIVGRTGAGKTSLMNALFRLINFSGDILIDNISTKSVGLHTLRHKLAVIPQDPILFSGTLRYNLDPFNQSSDLEIWNALERVQLKENIRSHPLGLQHPMSEGGSNFSVGERQLICLARALIRPSSILIMDEATANVDLRTDHIIQTTIREQFRDKTVLVIAHRLHTIIDSDVVMVLDQGRLIEFDSPANLLTQEGVFADMIKRTGPAMAEELKAKAIQYQIERTKKELTKDEEDQFYTDKARIIKDIKDDMDEVPIIRFHQSTNKGQNSSG